MASQKDSAAIPPDGPVLDLPNHTSAAVPEPPSPALHGQHTVSLDNPFYAFEVEQQERARKQPALNFKAKCDAFLFSKLSGEYACGIIHRHAQLVLRSAEHWQ